MESIGWQIRVDMPQALVEALYVRDAAVLRPRSVPDLPALLPHVNGQTASDVLTRLASEQWSTWWELLLREPTHAVVEDRFLTTVPELRGLVAGLHGDARRYVDARKRELARRRMGSPLEGRIVDQVERRQRRGLPADFRLQLLEMPLSQPGSWRLDQDTYLVSTMLCTDEAPYSSWLADVLTSKF